tara:strand:+ start:627 stop:881 length:255 start_codon:yes stop_codon:yes gene_type:complete
MTPDRGERVKEREERISEKRFNVWEACLGDFSFSFPFSFPFLFPFPFPLTPSTSVVNSNLTTTPFPRLSADFSRCCASELVNKC